jgi:isoleucyl-tRNA synthetase
VIAGDFVTNDVGTGVVHCAPGFGVEDYKVCLKNGLIKPDNPPVPLDASGRFNDQVPDFKGVYVKDADKEIRRLLKANGRMIVDT